MEEKCPKCQGFSIQWDGSWNTYRCLKNDCHHTWTHWDNGPKEYDSIQNVWLKASLPPGGPVPYAQDAP